MRSIHKFLPAGLMLCSLTAFAHGPATTSLIGVPIPPVPGLLDGPDPIIIDKDKAIALGKALFWDTNVGSDGQACGSCHFSAGADGRIKNQIDPGTKSRLPSGQTFDTLGSGTGGPNHTLTLSDFPLHQTKDPFNKASGVLRTTDDVISSAGTFSGQFTGASRFSGADDQCGRSADPIHNIHGVGTRRVAVRNTPTVINAVFNHRNFWDGRANNVFNGSSIWGDRDPNAGVWVKVDARSAVKQKLHLENAALASQAVGPGLNDLEMSCQKRGWPDVGRKLLLRPPLQNQKVHYDDSVFAPLNLALSTPGNLRNGLNTTYKNLIVQAFNPKYWSYTRIGQFGGPTGQTPYNQMEANFSMFFGLAIQMYESTLVSDQAPIDTSRRDADLIPIDLSPEAQQGFLDFKGIHCNICHAGPVTTTAAIIANATLVTPTPGKTYGPSHSPIPFGRGAMGAESIRPGIGGVGDAGQAFITPAANVVNRDQTTTAAYRLTDMGFANTAIADENADPGLGGTDDFGNPLSFTSQYIQYLLDNPAGILDGPVTKVKACDFANALGNMATVVPQTFTQADGLIQDGSKEGIVRDENCINDNWDPSHKNYLTGKAAAKAQAYIPTAAAAKANLNGAKMAYMTQGVFKIPSLRNIELTGPYMHNGSIATLEQVIESYARGGNFDSIHRIKVLSQATTGALNAPTDVANMVAFLKSLTDERVRNQSAPFDHPEITIANGHIGDESGVESGNPLNPALAKEEYLVIPAVGAHGADKPLPRFDERLAP